MIQCEVCWWTAWAADIATVVGVFVAIIGGIFAYNSWKRELHGAARFKLAQEILVSVYSLRKAVSHFRSPLKPRQDAIDDWKEKYPSFEEDSKYPWLYRYPSLTDEIADLEEKWLPVSKAAAEVEVPDSIVEILLHPEVNNILVKISGFTGLLFQLAAEYKLTLLPAIGLKFEERSTELASAMWEKHRQLFFEPRIQDLELFSLIEQIEHELKRYLKD